MLIDAECRDSEVGKLTPAALYVHRTSLPSLSTHLRVYEGCARVLIGDVPDATVVKMSRREPKISYLSYPTFDTDPHPPLHEGYTVSLSSLTASYRSYADSPNPPILHRKETMVGSSYPHREKFARLSAQEERWGLLEDATGIGTREALERRLRACWRAAPRPSARPSPQLKSQAKSSRTFPFNFQVQPDSHPLNHLRQHPGHQLPDATPHRTFQGDPPNCRLGPVGGAVRSRRNPVICVWWSLQAPPAAVASLPPHAAGAPKVPGFRRPLTIGSQCRTSDASHGSGDQRVFQGLPRFQAGSVVL